jgi:hypothetical protein
MDMDKHASGTEANSYEEAPTGKTGRPPPNNPNVGH